MNYLIIKNKRYEIEALAIHTEYDDLHKVAKQRKKTWHISFYNPDTKKYIIGTISFGVLGSLVAGIVLSLFRISVEFYSYANIFALFLFLITFLLFYLVTDRIYN